MNKYILCSVGGAAAGALTVYAVMRKKMENFKKLQKEFKKVQDETLKNSVDILDKSFKSCGESSSDEEKKALAEEAEHYRKLYYDILRDEYSATQSKIPEPEEDIVPLAPEEDPLSEIGAYAITIADFMDDVRYKKIYCEYYRATDSLVDTSTDTEIDKREALGDMWELLDGWVGNEVYIRNTATNTDYEIDFLPGAFGDGGD